MEILEKRYTEQIWSAIVECSGKGNSHDNSFHGNIPCGSKLKINLKDLFITTHTSWDGSCSYYYTFKCPCCGCLTDINKSMVPESFQAYINKKESGERVL